ncbi:MAG TPA: adenylate/guanylate cyclase domain-containing protein [Ilumatobacteraceae bacterium]|nr:adenylate/guanylate cyclase domain-containing protein [Ilumatobacteraceae bacterium]
MAVERTIAFVDLAGFTALTEAHGDDAAVDLLDTFAAAAVESVADTTAELVKTIGDALMLAAPSPDVGLHAARRVYEACYANDAFPEPRGGLHHGPVVARDGDYFGATVNLAARVASRAESGQTLVTSAVASAARDAGLDTLELGSHQLRNIRHPVELWAVELCPAPLDFSIDPVCRMRVSSHAAVARVHHRGREHWLCSLDCLRAFSSNPDDYLDSGDLPHP